jgi:hypothetical protein
MKPALVLVHGAFAEPANWNVSGWETAGSRTASGTVRSHDGAPDGVPGRSGEIAMTRQGASDIVARAALSEADQYRILALPYPVGYQVFWQELAGRAVTQERLMDRMGASP